MTIEDNITRIFSIIERVNVTGRPYIRFYIL